jgi:hypothetical protein
VRVVERRQRADAHELLSADLDNADTGVIVEMGYDSVHHGMAFALRDCKNFGRTIAMNGFDS